MVGMLDSKTGVRSNDSAAAADDEGDGGDVYDGHVDDDG